MIELTRNERIVYEALVRAAEDGRVCPDHLELNDEPGYESTSASPTVVGRLEEKGYIKVIQRQTSREVWIAATGKWTAPNPKVRSRAPLVPRGAHDSSPLLFALSELGVTEERAHHFVKDFRSIMSLEKRLNRAVELTERRKMGFILGGRKEVAHA